MIDVKVCPATLQSGFETYSPSALRELFDGKLVSHIIDVDFDSDGELVEVKDNLNNLSISGVQEKFSAVVDSHVLRLASENEQGTYILKPAPNNYRLYSRKQIPANEHLTMQIANQVYGIRTAKNGLCFTKSGQCVYLTKRFDVKTDLTKYMMEDFASVLDMTEQNGGSNFKYHGNYVQIADAIKRYIPTWVIEMDQFFKTVLFCYLYANEDAHMKNFSLINKDGEYFLSPAYDLLNTCLHIQSGNDFALDGGLSPELEKSDAYEKTGHPCRLDFERFAQRISLPKVRANKTLDMFMEIPNEVYGLIDRSFLNDKMKRSYKRIIEERHHRFIRTE